MPAMVMTRSTPGTVLAMLLDLLQRLLRAAERGAVGKLHGCEKISLILDRQKAGRDARHSVDGGPDDRHGDQNHRAAVADHPPIRPAYRFSKRSYRRR